MKSVKTSHERYTSLALRVGRIGLFECVLSQDRVELSRRLCEIHGLRPGEFDGTTAGYRALLHPDDLLAVTAALENVLDSPTDLEFRIVRPGGEVRWLRMSLDSTPDTRTGAAIDITESKETEDFLCRAIHDLREPLRTVTSFTELLARNPAAGSGYLDFIRNGVAQMRAMIDGLKALQSPETWHPEPVDTGELIQDSAVVREALPQVWGDRQALQELFKNLLSNAYRFRRPEVPLQIEIKAVRQGPDNWQFCIRDNGQGFDPSKAQELFQPFRRLHARDLSGAGLGLARCRKIVNRHGGRIWAEGKPNEGATFYFTLPSAHLSASASPR